MTCEHQWHDATTSAGPEWVCGKCKIKYTETKKAPQVKRQWVGLTDKEIEKLVIEINGLPFSLCHAVEAKLKEKNNG
jgi:hypothetical protein